ncbi:discoidin domain-containing protein [Flammeovirga sp. SubArs3]|uniref:galactose-binding domain-containing protein n=1 Tax=Flammeovirga sp. SubArs3 TaxID=2995316 RepID=UPI00248BE02F|nr:discoidin domain-containing protein [Flammeovirga sp. SubArs3]
MKKLTFLVFCLLGWNTLFAQVMIDEKFNNLSNNWKAVNLSGGGSHQVSNGQLTIIPNNNSWYGVYNNQALSGHFYIEVEFTADDNVGLALFKKNGNNADVSNYSMITVENNSGTPVVQIRDKQNGQSDVLDNTGWANKNLRYKNTLNAQTHSVPFTSTNKKFRIFRHEGEKFIHFFYEVKKNVDGQEAVGWQELAPSKEWNQLSGEFYLGLVALGGSATFDNAYATTKPKVDKDDTNTGFSAQRRELNWSGYFGEALVVTFDKNDAPLTDGKRKFVFWSELNYVPSWYLDDSLMYTYEFVETWGGGNPGCHEPMSDRILRYSNVTLDYDGADYKIVHWEYALIDPDYKSPDDGQGTQIPWVDEWYKIYPDGTILRKIRYKAKLDTNFRNWHELTEFIVISGHTTDPSEHLSNPSLSIWPINGNSQSYHPTGHGNNYEQSNNDATLIGIHFKDHPDVVSAFNDNASNPETYAGEGITFYKTWHDAYYHMSHWPVNKEQYYTDDFKSQTTWKEQVKHASLGGAGVYGGSNWNNNYQIDTDGRKYREWISYLSLSTKGDFASKKADIEAWLTDTWNWDPTGTTPEPPVDPTPPPTETTNVALNKNVVTSSVSQGNQGSNAVDGDGSTRWESNHSDNQWLYVDLGQTYSVSSVEIDWEAAYSSSYKIEVSNNANNWTEVYSTSSANGGTDVINFTPTNAQYVRLYGQQRATNWGHSLYEFRVLGEVPSVVEPVELAYNKSVTTSSVSQGNQGSNAVDGDGNTRWESNHSDNEWLYVDLGASYDLSKVEIDWEAAYSSSYKIELSNDASNWTEVYSTSSGNGGSEQITISGSGRYVRLYGQQRATGWGHSLYEFRVYGNPLSGSRVRSSALPSDVDFKVYPNPASTTLTVEMTLDNSSINVAKLMNFQGVIVLEEILENTLTEFRIDNVPEGMYILLIEKNGEIENRQKVIIK